jgi:eukaryotic-like serine/threonine-protein kinase
MRAAVEGAVIGSYHVGRKLGEGGMGAVYLGHHTLLGRRAAIKVLLPALSEREDLVNRFFNEARAATSISDPGVVQIFDFGYHTDGSAFIIMEYLDGESLDARLARFGRLPAADALRLARQAATSLAAAHAQNIVHRDLKPENIYLVRDPEVASGERVKILDFGIAKLSDDHPSRGAMMKTQTGALMGTPVYMSPEQCRGASELDHRSDIYALGCVLFQLLVGVPPFDGEGMGEIIARHITEAPRAPGISPAVDAIVLRCLAKEPGERFQSMSELATAIGTALAYITSPESATVVAGYAAGITPVPRTSVTPPHPSRPQTPTTIGSSAGEVTPPATTASRGRRRMVVGLVAAIGVTGAAVGWVATTRNSAATAPMAASIDAPRPPPPPPDAPAPAIDAAVVIDAAPPPIDAAPVPVDAPPKRIKHAKPAAGSAPAPTSDGCDHATDLDCDGIPDKR